MRACVGARTYGCQLESRLMGVSMKIVTNNVPRLLIDANQLTDKEREDFDYLNWEAIDSGNDSASFFRYKGQLYDLGEFTRTDQGGELRELGWIGCSANSAFTATLVKICEDTDYVIVGWYMS